MRSEARAWLGVDVGTQGLRVVAVGDDGQPVAAASRRLTSVRSRDGRHEQDPRDWRDAAAAACGEVRALIRSHVIGGLAICGTSGTILLGTDQGDPLTPALMYDDARAAANLDAVRHAWRECAERNAYSIAPTWAAPKLSWLLRNVADGEKARVYHVPDFLGTWLAGHPVAVDYSHALKTGYDLVNQRWPFDAFDSIGISANVLPEVVAPGSLVGAIGPDAAAATGLPEGTPLVAGMTDGCASQIASGAVRVGDWNCALGTTFVLKGVSRDLLRDPLGAVYSHRHPDGGWLPGGASSSGAGALAAAFPDTDPAQLDRAALQHLPTPVIRYPLASRGERFPFVRPDAVPFECEQAGSDGERAAAVMQGVVFVERLSLSYLRGLGADTSGTVTLTGGGARSKLWKQLHADVLGRAVAVPENPEAAVGMAILAAAGRGSLAETARRMVRFAGVIEPQPESATHYLPLYKQMIDELEQRGYIDAEFAERARVA